MFENILPDDINVFAATATNATTSSYACDYSHHIGSYINDCFSVNWLMGNFLNY